MHTARVPVVLLAIGALAIAVGACSKAPPASQPTFANSAVNAPAPAPAASTSAAAGVQLPDFSSLVDAYGAAVVNVSVVSKPETQSSLPGLQGIPEDDPFFRFFRRFGGPNSRNESQVPQRGLGSGFIVDTEGHILTNAHVVGDASQVTVRLTDRREFPAKVVGFDRRSDVAVIKIEAKNLPTVKLGDASKLKPGQWVVAIGAPFGFENSVTAGIVSAISRSLPDEQGYVPFIQTDVPVNPGNSGGPLFNMSGEVIGINSQIYTRTGGFMGVSFAIPIDVAKNIEEQLIKTGTVRRGRIGVTIQEVNAQLAESFGLDRPRGALVSSVEKGGPADKAGLKPGDVILGVNGKPIERSYDLPTIVASLEPGKAAEFSLWRDRAERKTSVEIALLKEETAHGNASGRSDDSSGLGLAVQPLTPDQQREANTRGKLLVAQVTGAAANAGVQPGDIILAINGQEVTSIDQLRSAVKKAGKTVALLVQREDAQIFIPVPLTESAG